MKRTLFRRAALLPVVCVLLLGFTAMEGKARAPGADSSSHSELGKSAAQSQPDVVLQLASAVKPQRKQLAAYERKQHC